MSEIRQTEPFTRTSRRQFIAGGTALGLGSFGRIASAQDGVAGIIRDALAMPDIVLTNGRFVDYRGIVGVVLVNNSTETFIVSRGDRIAQLIVAKIALLEPIQIVSLGDTVRGQGGFGSTGK